MHLPDDFHDYHTNYQNMPVHPSCPQCQWLYDNHDCHNSPDDGCAFCATWRELNETWVDHVQGDVDQQLLDDAREVVNET
jgi:hypothetical protein